MQATETESDETAAQRVYDFAKWAILSAVYQGGDVLTEAQLAAEVGAGVGAAREALLRLRLEQLVNVVPGRGAVVRTFSAEDAEAVLEVRVLLESHAAARAFAHRRELLPELRDVHEAMQRAVREGSTASFAGLDRSFHELIVDAAGNPVISEIYATLRERQALFTSSLTRGRPERMAMALAEHERIVQSLAGDSVEDFRAVVDAHLAWSVRLVRESR